MNWNNMSSHIVFCPFISVIFTCIYFHITRTKKLYRSIVFITEVASFSYCNVSPSGLLILRQFNWEVPSTTIYCLSYIYNFSYNYLTIDWLDKEMITDKIMVYKWIKETNYIIKTLCETSNII
jgi:hypothetical protein